MFSTQPEPDATVQSLFDLTGRVALITGASGYLGKALSFALAEVGATVVVSSRQRKKADEIADQLEGPAKGKHIGIALDHMDEASLDSGFNELIEKTGALDILVNNGHFPLAKDLTEGINFAIKSETVQTFLKSNKIKLSSSFYNKKLDSDDLLELLEEGTVYTFCN